MVKILLRNFGRFAFGGLDSVISGAQMSEKAKIVTKTVSVQKNDENFFKKNFKQLDLIKFMSQLIEVPPRLIFGKLECKKL